MKPAGKWPGLALLLIAVIAGFWISRSPRHDSTRTLGQGSPEPIRKRANPPDFEAERDTADAAARRQIEADWADLLRWLDSDPRPGPDEIRSRLLETRIAWAAMDPQVLAEALGRFLKSGDDRATGVDFRVGLHGFLSGWPTLRVFLLDVLTASDPEMAAGIANKLLDGTSSANEYATALRSLTRDGRGRADNSELLSRFGKMLDRPEWQRERGFAEALDLARFIGSSEAATRLAGWTGPPALKTMALEEFAADHPEKIGDIVNSSPALDGPTRAKLMARADSSDPDQLSTVDAYLRNPELSQDEAAILLKTFPLRSATTGFRLYGKTPAPYTREQIAAGDRAALERVNQWAADPSLEKYRPEIQKLRERLEQWTRQAE